MMGVLFVEEELLSKAVKNENEVVLIIWHDDATNSKQQNWNASKQSTKKKIRNVTQTRCGSGTAIHFWQMTARFNAKVFAHSAL